MTLPTPTDRPMTYSVTLTDEQVNEFRRHPGSFGDMVQAIFDAGYQYAMLGATNSRADSPMTDGEL